MEQTELLRKARYAFHADLANPPALTLRGTRWEIRRRTTGMSSSTSLSESA